MDGSAENYIDDRIGYHGVIFDSGGSSAVQQKSGVIRDHCGRSGNFLRQEQSQELRRQASVSDQGRSHCFHSDRYYSVNPSMRINIRQGMDPSAVFLFWPLLSSVDHAGCAFSV